MTRSLEVELRGTLHVINAVVDDDDDTWLCIYVYRRPLYRRSTDMYN